MSETLVYMTCGSTEEAEKIGRALVEKRLAACINMFDGMRSLYWWEGKVEQGSEVVLLAKTTANLVDELTEEVKRLHEYDVPCVVTLPITGGNADFLRWIHEETQSEG